MNLKKYLVGALVLISLSGSLYLNLAVSVSSSEPYRKDEIRKTQTPEIAQRQNQPQVLNASLEPPKKVAADFIRVLHVALEYNGAEVGGIAAVTKTLIPKLNESSDVNKVQATLIMPKYSFLEIKEASLKKIRCIEHIFRKNWVKSCVYEANNDLLLVDSEDENLRDVYQIQDKNGIYTEDKNFAPIERWLHFNSAVAAFASQYKEPVSEQPFHIIHLHSYHAGITVELLKSYRNIQERFGLKPPKTIFHMHGLSYDQGWIKGHLLESVGLQSSKEWENLTKRILANVDFVVMVSKNMLTEALSTDESRSFGLRASLLSLNEENRVRPILNGINSKEWDPLSAKVLPPKDGNPYTFGENDLEEGKRRIKTLLMNQGYFSRNNKPLVTFIGRFSDEKGIEHLHAAASEVVRLGGNFAIMGSYGKSFNSRQMISRLIALAKTEPFLGRLLILDSVEAQKNNSLGNYVRAATDFSFVPSKEETCGLVPLEFFGFGAMTITYYVGGLKDTIIPYSPSREFFNGFVFKYNDSDDLYWSIRQAFGFMQENPEQLSKIRKNILRAASLFDWSTENGAVSKMLTLYRDAVFQ